MLHYLKFFLSPFLTMVTAYYVFQGGAYMWVGLGIIALLMLIGDNISGDDKSQPSFQHSWIFALPLYGALPIMFFLEISLAYAVKPQNIAQANTSAFDFAGAILGSALIILGYGMTAGHELVHKTHNKISVVIGRWLFALIANADFSIEHVQGHHAHLGTTRDPATARRGENVYRFFIRSTVKGHLHAWSLERGRLGKKKLSLWSWHNRLLTGYGMTLCWLGFFAFIAGLLGVLLFLVQAVLGKFVLEVINYIEHYGLIRQAGEKVLAHHSWNSNRRLSYITLLGLARHSAHHEKGSLPFYQLSPHPLAPLMPFGYLTSLVIALVPPLWFKIMHKELQQWDKTYTKAG